MSYKIIIDTNIFISSFIFGGRPRIVTNLCFFDPANFQICTSEQCLNELKEKFLKGRVAEIITSAKREILAQSILPFVKDIEDVSTNFHISEKFKILGKTGSRDLKDNMFLELAEVVQADYIITGDKDLLVLKSYLNTKIVTIAEFLELFSKP
jgi:uncharacterized protein